MKTQNGFNILFRFERNGERKNVFFDLRNLQNKYTVIESLNISSSWEADV